MKSQGQDKQEKTVKQAAQVLELLEFFADFRRPATLADISSALGWPRSSTYNLLMTLARLGYLYEPRPKGGFFPSTRWASVVEQIRLAAPPPKAMRDLIEYLTQVTGETTAIAVMSGAQAMFLDVEESPSMVRFTASVGQTVPLYATVVGRALLSHLSSADFASVMRKTTFAQLASRTLMSAAAVEQDIRLSLQRGWFQGSEGFSDNLSGVALPLSLPPFTYAVLVAGPTERMKHRMAEIAQTMRGAVRDYLKITLPDPATR